MAPGVGPERVDFGVKQFPQLPVPITEFAGTAPDRATLSLLAGGPSTAINCPWDGDYVDSLRVS